MITQRNSHNKNHYPVSFYGCRENTKIINQYCNAIDYNLALKNEFHYTELDSCSLTPIVNSNKPDAIVLPEKTVIPIPFEEATERYVSHAPIAPLITNKDIFAVKLFNGLFKGYFYDYDIEQLYFDDSLLGELFRFSVPKEVYEKNMNCS
ncbi:hypothetical protein BK026_08400 [Alteromonas sp. V450]|nr:hypothetical protein BK026_08400 [Alteromonas sp. V450]